MFFIFLCSVSVLTVLITVSCVRVLSECYLEGVKESERLHHHHQNAKNNEDDMEFNEVPDRTKDRPREWYYAYDSELTLTHRPDQPEAPKDVVYIAGPMQGYPRYNFDAFYDAEKKLKDAGYGVVNPARVDEERGFDPDDKKPLSGLFLWMARRRDIGLINDHATHIYMLPGWEKSKGAIAEYHFANWTGLKLIEFRHGIATEVDFPENSGDDKEED